MTYNLYLDDVRTPKDSFYGGPSLMPGNSIYLNDNWQVVRSYKEFVEKIYDMGMPENVSFDHDLADEHMKFYFTRIVPFNEDPTKANFNEKTGYDCALFLITYAEENNLPIPNFYVHSANPIGAKRIKELLSDYTRYRAEGVSKDFVDYKNRQRANAR